jgi:hypothetical protein
MCYQGAVFRHPKIEELEPGGAWGRGVMFLFFLRALGMIEVAGHASSLSQIRRIIEGECSISSVAHHVTRT